MKCYENREISTSPASTFALNRASIDWLALRNRTYTGMELEQQLEAATHAFLSDRSRNRVNEKAEKLDWLVSRRL